LTRSEFHPDPDKALSGGAQSRDFVTFERLLVELKKLAERLGRSL
jgi:3-deoxy-D-arabino-heptulosonate 7-phosphate (DAHP) synthase